MSSPLIAIVSSSLNSDSYSRVLAREAQRVLEQAQEPASFVDLRDFPLPLCDGETASSDPQVQRIEQLLRPARAIIVATPVYNYDVNAALKNLIELTGDAWENKVVAFLCAAGGMSSYMSIMALANSLMLDFRSLIVPRFVYATGRAFTGDQVTDGDIKQRIADLALTTARLSSAWEGALGVPPTTG